MFVSRINHSRAQIGEGPLWLGANQELIYVDILGKQITSYDSISHKVQRWATPSSVAAVASTPSQSLMTALSDGFYSLDRSSGQFSIVASVKSPPNVYLSDGKVDRQGRFVAVSSDFGFAQPLGSVVQLGHDGEIRTLDDGFVVGNGPAWSKDGSQFFVCQSLEKVIYVYKYNTETGLASDRRVFVSTEDFDGIPDGATVDAENHLWVVIHGAGLILRFDPDGVIERSIELPTLNITSLTFGGRDLDELYVTSLNPSKLPRKSDTHEQVGGPLDAGAGYLFHVTGLGIAGIIEPHCITNLT